MNMWYRYRWAFVPEVDVDSYDGPGTTLLEGEQGCKPHVVRILEGLHHRYGVNMASTNTSNIENDNYLYKIAC